MAPKPTTTDPINEYSVNTAPRLSIAPGYTDPKTGAVYVHRDFEPIPGIGPWESEAHISPIKEAVSLGDIESWTAYVKRFAGKGTHAPLLKWGESGLGATIDYHTEDGEPGRCQWTASHPFKKTVQWQRWERIADGLAKSQGDVLEFFEDNAPDIKEPTGGEIAHIIRKLRATVNVTAETTLGEDGSTALSYDKTTGVKADGDLLVPASILISIPLLKGHTGLVDVRDDDGTYIHNDDGTIKQRVAPVVFELEVKIRVSVGSDHRPWFRLTIPRSEQAFEAVYADRVAAAKALLGDLGETLYRATA